MRLVSEVTAAFAEAFTTVNEIADADARREAFSLRMLQLSERYAE